MTIFLNARPRLRLRAALLAAALLLGSAAYAVDPFYERLMLEGVQAYHRGEMGLAAKHLRLAVFGFLDEPDLLTRGLLQLGLAQAALTDWPGFRATAQRVAEIDEMFQVYERSTIIPVELKADFERLVLQQYSESELKAMPLFSKLRWEKIWLQISSLPREQGRKELEARSQAEPEQAEHWKQLRDRLSGAETKPGKKP